MPTLEQKIEQLLNDLNKFAQNEDYCRSYGLPCNDTFDMLRMKIIVHEFVNSLKKDDKLKGFNENQLNAYHAFIDAGIPEKWANVMADRVTDDGWKGVEKHYLDYIWAFTTWKNTKEGEDFWFYVAWKVADEGLLAFSKLECPQ